MKFATKLTTAFLILALTIIFLISYFAYSSNMKILEEGIKRELEGLAFHTIDKIDRTLYERFGDIQVLAKDSTLSSRHSTPEQILEKLQDYKKYRWDYGSLSFFDLNRVRIADTDGFNLGKQHKMVKYWEDILEGRVSAAADIRVAEELHIPIIYFAAPVRDKNGVPFGGVVARMPISTLDNIVSQTIKVYGKSELLAVDMVNRDGLLLYSNIRPEGILKDNLSKYESVQRSWRGEKFGSLIHIDPRTLRTDVFAFTQEQGFVDFKGNDWTLLIHIPTQTAFQPAVELKNTMILIALPVTILAIFVAFIFSRSLSRPILKLRETADEIGKGNLNVEIEVKSQDEIGDLASAFKKMTSDLKRTTVSRNYVENIITTMINALIVMTAKGTIQTVNQATCELLGYKTEELVGKEIGVIFAEEETHSLLYHHSFFKNLNKTGDLSYLEKTFLAKDGRKIPVLLSGSVMWETEGRVAGIVCVAMDITERKQAEEELVKHRNHLEELVEERSVKLKASQAQMIHLEKLSALGKLTGSISHEFNNPIQGIRNVISILSKSVFSKEDVRLAELGTKECDRMARMIRGLRDFYKPTSGEFIFMDINKCIEEVLALKNKSLKDKGIKVNQQFDDNLPKVEVVEDQIKQVLLNLFQNSEDSISGKGQITLTTEKQDSRIIIEVQDTGSGIKKEDVENLFEPFYTSKEAEKGTGLGLSISYGIIRDHGGDIEVESELNKGSTFRICLPIREKNTTIER